MAAWSSGLFSSAAREAGRRPAVVRPVVEAEAWDRRHGGGGDLGFGRPRVRGGADLV
jgi:hypothetical protein